MRTDAHTPRNFNPADYEVVAYVYVARGQVGTPNWINELPAELRADVEQEILINSPERQRATLRQYWPDLRVPGTDTGKVDRCSHCGLRISHIAIAKHLPTGQHIPLGLDCAERAHMGSKAELLSKANGRTRDELQYESLIRSLERNAMDALDGFRAMKPSLTGSVNFRARETCRAMSFWIRDDAEELAAWLGKLPNGRASREMGWAAGIIRRSGYLYPGTAEKVAKSKKYWDFLAAQKPAAPQPAQSIPVTGTVRVTRNGKSFLITSTGDRIMIAGSPAGLAKGQTVTLIGRLTRPDATDPKFGILKVGA
jgi:hypothetical protein